MFLSVTVVMIAMLLTLNVTTVDTFILPAWPIQAAMSRAEVDRSDHEPVMLEYAELVKPLFTYLMKKGRVRQLPRQLQHAN